MNPIILTSSFCFLLLSACNKPTSGQNTTEYRDGQSGATSGTLKNDTAIDSSKKDKDE